MAQAKPNPSFVDVPLPNSSIIIKLFEVAVYIYNKNMVTFSYF